MAKSVIRRKPRKSPRKSIKKKSSRVVRKSPAKKSRRKSPVRGWSKLAPKTRSARKSLYKSCGKKCFLKPNHKSPGKSKFPICRKGSRNCKENCKGLLAAFIRARQFRKKVPSYNRVAKSAKSKAQKKGCRWSKSKSKKNVRK